MDTDDTLADIDTSKRMLRFAIPSIITMVCISSYTIVDGILLSNMVGTDAMAGLNIVMPVATVLNAFGLMLATGGSAYIATRLGEGNVKKAREAFTSITIVAVTVSVIIGIVTLMFIDPLVTFLGANDLRGYSTDYLVIMMIFAPAFVLQFLSTQFLITAGRPGLSLASSLIAGMANISLDVLFMGPMHMGIKGCALASNIGALLPFVMATVYFTKKKDCPLRYVRPSFDRRMLWNTCSNGASEMVGQLSASVTTLLFNLTMMKYVGSDGVAAITVVIYLEFLATAVIMGYSMGVEPLMSYNNGAKRRNIMSTLFRTSMTFVLIVSVMVFLSVASFGWVIVDLFVNGNVEVYDLAVRGSGIFAPAFLFMGIGLYGSSLFTSLSNGRVSAFISLLRCLALLAPMIVLLPMVFDTDGIWMAVPVTEALTALVTAVLMIRYGRRYGYLKRSRIVADA